MPQIKLTPENPIKKLKDLPPMTIFSFLNGDGSIFLKCVNNIVYFRGSGKPGTILPSDTYESSNVGNTYGQLEVSITKG